MIYDLVNREDLRPLTGTLYPVSEFEHEEWIRRVATGGEQKLFLVTDKSTDAFLGTIGLKNFDRKNQNAELYISLDSPGGYGADAVSALTQYCFERLNLHRVYLYVFAYNIRAIKCYEKAGFQCEGVLEGHHFEYGKYVDVLVMAKVNQ